MVNPAESPGLLKIRKYPNRRFYDATRSCNVTLSELHALICQGYELTVSDSATGQDITNLILTQIIIEHDPPKLDFFPPNILHQVIRTQQKMLGGVAAQFLRQVFDAQRASQEQWTRFMQTTMGSVPWLNQGPMDWTRAMMSAFMPAASTQPLQQESRPAHEGNEPAQHSDELAQLREQLRIVMMRLGELERGKSSEDG